MVGEAIGRSSQAWEHRESEFSATFREDDPPANWLTERQTERLGAGRKHISGDFFWFPRDPLIVSRTVSSMGKNPWPGIGPYVEELRDALEERLDAQCATSSDWAPTGIGQR